MNELTLVEERMFGIVACKLYENKDKEIFVTRTQIGEALEYSNPTDAIKNIHSRNKDRLDKFSVQLEMSGADGKLYNSYLYNAKGMYEICRFSRQPKADAFMDWVWDLLEGIRKQELIILETKLLEQQEQVDNYNYLTNADNCLSMLKFAKGLRVGRNKLFKFLREEKILMGSEESKNIPYQSFIERGIFHTILGTVVNNGKVKDVVITTVTPKGIDYLVNFCKKKGFIEATSQFNYKV